MLNVQKYLQKNSLEKLREELDITITDYPDLVVLNYGIKSPKFHPVCDECRALILEKGTWKVLARSFDRFYNYHEGEVFKNFPWQNAVAEEKLDGSLISMWWYRDHWEVATRKMAFAEGTLNMGVSTFRDLWLQAISAIPLGYVFWAKTGCYDHTYYFELTSPSNRIVTRYADTRLRLLGIRDTIHGNELPRKYVDQVATEFGVQRPQSFPCSGLDDVVAKAEALDPLEEGFVVVADTREESLRRIKIKNSRYLAIAHVRQNGQVSAKRLLTLVMAKPEDLSEFLGYFPEYEKYTMFLKGIWDATVLELQNTWQDIQTITNQKEFALAAQARTKNPIVLSALFSLKKGKSMEEVLGIEPDRVYKSLDIKKRFEKKFDFKSNDDIP